MENKNYLRIVSAFALGFVVSSVLFLTFSENNSIKKITFLPKFEIQNYFDNFIGVQGVYLDEFKNIHISKLDCDIVKNTCTDSPIVLTNDGVLVPIGIKFFDIIEKSPTRIVAKFEGSAQYHLYAIDLATRKVVFKTQDNTNDPSTADVYELSDGTYVLNND